MQVETLLEQLANEHNLRTLHTLEYDGIYVFQNGARLLNLASNDYLNVATDKAMYQEFVENMLHTPQLLGSTSSRSLSGNHAIFTELEEYIASHFPHKSCLLFNSGYHLNISCIQALSMLNSILFVVDKYVHASVIDGLRLGKKRWIRYEHNDMNELHAILLSKHKEYDMIVVVSEGVFSMEGDTAPLQELCALKRQYDNVLLYIDEAHSVGVFGESGLGLAHSLSCADEIDFLVFTFGKAIGSCGASMLCAPVYREFFVNKARGLIYSSALAPINIAWSLFVFHRLSKMQQRRKQLLHISALLRQKCLEIGITLQGEAHILSYIVHSNERAITLAAKLYESGFFAPAIKTPSVPPNTARIRFSLTSEITDSMMDSLVGILQDSHNNMR